MDSPLNLSSREHACVPPLRRLPLELQDVMWPENQVVSPPQQYPTAWLPASHSEMSSSPSPPPMRQTTLRLTQVKQRGPKHPVPEELKDEGYFKRRKRNNEAAKRSRAARRQRQENDMIRNAEMELENASLRAQALQLRVEYEALAAMVVQRSIERAAWSFQPSVNQQAQVGHNCVKQNI